jgi:hypothetical protein
MFSKQYVSRQYQCPECGGPNGYRSRRRNLYEKYFLPVMLSQPVRCADCFRRNHVSIFIDVPERRRPKSGLARQATA